MYVQQYRKQERDKTANREILRVQRILKEEAKDEKQKAIIQSQIRQSKRKAWRAQLGHDRHDSIEDLTKEQKIERFLDVAKIDAQIQRVKSDEQLADEQLSRNKFQAQ